MRPAETCGSSTSPGTSSMWLRARVDRLDELGHDVEDQHALTCVGEGHGERKPDVTGAHDGDVPGPFTAN